MKENNELLMHIYENGDMGVKATKYLLKLLKTKDNKIKSLLETQLHEYEEFLKESKKILKKKSLSPKNRIFTSVMANSTMGMEVDKDNSDSKIADILTRGFVMGKINLEKKIESYEKETDKDVLKLAKKSMEFQTKQIENLKKYL